MRSGCHFVGNISNLIYSHSKKIFFTNRWRYWWSSVGLQTPKSGRRSLPSLKSWRISAEHMTGSLRLHLHWLRFAEHVLEMNLSTCKLCGSLYKRECSDLVSYPSVHTRSTWFTRGLISSCFRWVPVIPVCSGTTLPLPFDLDFVKPFKTVSWLL